ncbi:alpha/beta fold hydrolase [candidate division GN15 bacterium]|nr:alpha/beta fold hydrolase [candidate division GN15 bacterium]
MPYARIPNELKLYYEENGKGEPVIFLHGFTLDIRQWECELEVFGRGWRAIAYDALGHGKSSTPDTGYGRDDRVEHLRAFIDALGLERAHVVGLSMGGVTAIGFALAYPERLRSMTLVSTGAAGYGVGKKIQLVDQAAREKGLEAAREKWKRTTLSYYTSEKRRIRDLMQRMIDEHSGAIWADPMRGKYPKSNDLQNVHRIETPTLLLAGTLDRIFLPLAHKLDKRLPNSRLQVFEDVGHMINLEAPERFERSVKQFLETIAPGG